MIIAISQLNSTVGDLAGNAALINNAIQRAKNDANILVFPEMVLTGYPTKDLIFDLDFIDSAYDTLLEISKNVFDIVVLVGFVRRENDKIYNSVAIIQSGKIIGFRDKTLLPNYDVFDERRYFENGNSVVIFDLNINEGKEVSIKPKVINQNTKIEKILILDTETTGLDENKDEVIEIGGILFDVSFKCVLSQVSFLFPVNNNEAEHVNGISAEVTNISQPWEDGLNFFLKLVDSSDYIVAHNVEFDKKWFGKGRLPKLNKKWICSLEDINWSFQKSLKTRPSVTDLALSFSIPVWNLHRALSDCFYISEVFKKCDNLEELLLKATEPRFLYMSLIHISEPTRPERIW